MDDFVAHTTKRFMSDITTSCCMQLNRLVDGSLNPYGWSWSSRKVYMDNTCCRIRRRGRPYLSWSNGISQDPRHLLGISNWWTLVQTTNVWSSLLRQDRPDLACCSVNNDGKDRHHDIFEAVLVDNVFLLELVPLQWTYQLRNIRCCWLGLTTYNRPTAP